MEIADELTHRVLAYVAAVTAQGEKITARELNSYAASPDHRAEQVNLMASMAVRMAATFTEMVERESFADYLNRVGWAVATATDCLLTPLGYAVLRSLNAPRVDPRETGAVEVVLDPADPFAYTRALGELVDAPGSMVVDAYFRLPQLMDIADLGTVTRVLTSPKIKKAEIKKLALGLRAVAGEPGLEIRLTPDVHDRFFIPARGRVRGLGTSLQGVGQSLTVLTTFGDEASQVLRELHEAKWASAEVLAPATPEAPPTEAQEA